MKAYEEKPKYVYDAFISYSRKNSTFAAKLEKALKDYKPPKDLDVPQRHINVFRDVNDFTGSDYDQEKAKGSSPLLAFKSNLLLCTSRRWCSWSAWPSPGAPPASPSDPVPRRAGTKREVAQ